MEGFIALHRKMVDWEWYTDANVMRVFLHCLLKANYETRNWRGIVIKRGQFVTSVKTLSQELNLTPRQISVALDKLKRTNEMSIKTSNKNSTITICKYDDYQTIGAPQCKTKRQAKQQTNVEQDVTQMEIKCEQHNNNNNDNNTTSEQEIKSNTDVLPKNTQQKRFQKPLLAEIKAYCIERGNNVDAEKFYAYYESNGWKVGRNPMRDWRAAVRTWEKQDSKRANTTPLFDDRAESERIQQQAQAAAQRRRQQQEAELEAKRIQERERINDIIFNNNNDE